MSNCLRIIILVNLFLLHKIAECQSREIQPRYGVNRVFEKGLTRIESAKLVLAIPDGYYFYSAEKNILDSIWLNWNKSDSFAVIGFFTPIDTTDFSKPNIYAFTIKSNLDKQQGDQENIDFAKMLASLQQENKKELLESLGNLGDSSVVVNTEWAKDPMYFPSDHKLIVVERITVPYLNEIEYRYRYEFYSKIGFIQLLAITDMDKSFEMDKIHHQLVNSVTFDSSILLSRKAFGSRDQLKKLHVLGIFARALWPIVKNPKALLLSILAGVGCLYIFIRKSINIKQNNT